jgi:Cu/Ag efflux pump CusA
MTTIAMIAGMVPSALAFGAGGEFRAPMAVSVIGGLLCSTVLSLVFVPAVFVLMDNVSRVTSRLSNRLISTGEPEIKGAPEHPAGH